MSKKLLRLLRERQAPFRVSTSNLEQLMKQGKVLSGRHQPVSGNGLRALVQRLKENDQLFLELDQWFRSLPPTGWQIMQNREWQSNFYVIQDQLFRTRNLLQFVLPDLPVLQQEEGNPLPRIYELLTHYIAHTNAQVETTTLKNFLTGYQSVMGLQVRELKAIPVMLKMALLENLRRLSLSMAAHTLQKHQEDGRMERLAGKTVLADRVSIRNSISSIRTIETIDWYAFQDANSVLEPVLQQSPCGLYGAMDYYTRDQYREKISKMAAKARLSETEIAITAVSLTRENALQKDAAHPAAHVGYYLMGAGVAQLNKAIMAKGGRSFQGRWPLSRWSLGWYLGTIGVLAGLVTVVFLWTVNSDELFTGWWIVAALLFFISASRVAKQMVDIATGLLKNSNLLPRLDYSKGIPTAARTLVVVPAMLTNENVIRELVRALEVRFLANRSPDIYFGLLTDFKDAQQETLPEDAGLLHFAQQQITVLNEKYSKVNPVFFLFHRPRTWNAGEKRWMGYERKRGKLMELNALLRGQGHHRFMQVTGNTALLTSIKYVITLDADTQLPRDTARKMIAAMAHPLNRPVLDEKKRRIVAGYGMLQPRVGIDLRGLNHSLFQQWNGNGPDLDPYTRAAPDVYQDVFGEGSFIGKGIYDVDVCLQVLHDRFPENRVLSHDLLEGCYMRSGLLNDVKLYERVSDYATDIKRRHRWIRGDWQIAAWAGAWVPGYRRGWMSNPLSLLSRWKIFDNLRNSIMPVVNMLLLVFGWIIDDNPVVYTLFVCWVLLSPAWIIFTTKLVMKPKRLLLWTHWKNAAAESFHQFLLNLFDIITLSFEAFLASDAILRSCWRMWVTRRKLLEWLPAGSHQPNTSTLLGWLYATMWAAPVTGVAAILYMVLMRQELLPVIFPFAICWMAAPLVAWQLMRPLQKNKTTITPQQTLFLHGLARKTWAQFEELHTKACNWLPPDHIQEYPAVKRAGYTSPTNMGLGLLANLTACDFGYISPGRLLLYASQTLHTMEKLERYKGHFYNWYDLHSLQPVTPRYVSTVDSGNLAGHLLVLRQGLLSIPQQPVLQPVLFKGLQDTWQLLKASYNNNNDPLMEVCEKAINTAVNASINNLQEFSFHINQITAAIAGLMRTEQPEHHKEAAYWLASLERQCRDLREELEVLSPWLQLGPAPEPYASLLPEGIPTLQQLASISIPMQEIETANHIHNSARQWLQDYRKCIVQVKRLTKLRLLSIERMAKQCAGFTNMEYDFLFNTAQQMLSIGYQVESGSQDPDCYDVLTSEARLAIFVGIAEGKLPLRNWFNLRRPVVHTDGTFRVLSANGTLFEYLMPMLVMPDFDNTLLNKACKAAVDTQIEYGRQHQLPWGVSESGYNAFDAALNYQYKVFGTPALSLKHHHAADDNVVAPYASMMALMVAPQEACRNLEQLSSEGFTGRYGFFEAIDYTPSRMQARQRCAPVQSYMVHHQGMGLLALAWLLLNKPMQARFLDDPMLESAVLMLQEQFPKDTAVHLKKTIAGVTAGSSTATLTLNMASTATFTASPEAAYPEMQLLSNGRYHSHIAHIGNSYMQWEDIVIAQWPDPDSPHTGITCFLHDDATGNSWAITGPFNNEDDSPAPVQFSEGSALFQRRENGLETQVLQMVSPGEDVEIRRITITNHSAVQRTILLTGSINPLLIPIHKKKEDAGALRYQTVAADHCNAVLYAREPVTDTSREPWLFFVMVPHHTHQFSGFDILSKETIAIQYSFALEPGQVVITDLCTGISQNRELCGQLLERFSERSMLDCLPAISHTYHQAVLNQINATEEEARLFRQMAGALLLARSDHQPEAPTLPSLVVRIRYVDHIERVAQHIRMHAYWRMNGLPVTLIILNEDQSCYGSFLQRLIMEIISSGIGAESLNRHGGGIFLKTIDKLSDEDVLLLQSATQVMDASRELSFASQTPDRVSHGSLNSLVAHS